MLFSIRRSLRSRLSAMLLLALAPLSIQAGLLPGNFWPNPTLEGDSNSDGVPDFWHRGGSSLGIDLWTTTQSVSATHAFQLNDGSSTEYGEWYSDQLSISAGANYQLRYNLRYTITN